MKITRQDPVKAYAIQSYQAGQVVINQQAYCHSLILTAGQLISDWRPQSADELTASDFEQLLALEPSVVILGTGKKQIFPPAALYACLMERGVGLEIMDTAAACRTYNIVMTEGRRVAAALIMI